MSGRDKWEPLSETLKLRPYDVVRAITLHANVYVIASQTHADTLNGYGESW